MGCTGIELQGLTHCSPKGLEDRLGLVVRVLALQVVNVQGHKGVVHKTLEELVSQLRIKGTDHSALERHIHHQTGTTREVNHHSAQSLVQGHISVAVASDASLVAQGFREGLPQSDPHILDRVVPIDVQVPLGVDLQIYQSMASDLVQHVVKKSNTRVQLGHARAVQIDLDIDQGLRGLASDESCSWCAHGLYSKGI